MSSEENFDIKSSYIIAQAAHITCKKDHYEILSETVSDLLSEGYEKLLSQIIVFVRPSSTNKKVNPILISKNSINIRLECDETDQSKFFVTYQTSGGSFTMTRQDQTQFPAGSEIIFVTPAFTIFITGDLSYYADVLGMPNSTSYWCPWCLLSHSEWNKAPEAFIPEARTLDFLSEMYLAVKNDADKKLKPTDQKGVLCERHY